MTYLMKCGHTTNTSNQDNKPVCAICFPSPDSMEVEETKPSLEGRTAKCGYCKNREPSRLGLPFFSHKPKEAEDGYYCGCFGWD